MLHKLKSCQDTDIVCKTLLLGKCIYQCVFLSMNAICEFEFKKFL